MSSYFLRVFETQTDTPRIPEITSLLHADHLIAWYEKLSFFRTIHAVGRRKLPKRGHGEISISFFNKRLFYWVYIAIYVILDNYILLLLTPVKYSF
jgi:hypothetical protein